jgi:hypothetical protein
MVDEGELAELTAAAAAVMEVAGRGGSTAGCWLPADVRAGAACFVMR